MPCGVNGRKALIKRAADWPYSDRRDSYGKKKQRIFG
jgi:hypothetical protein